MARDYLHAGQRAPHFNISDVFGKNINLDNYEDGYVLLVFLRYAGCPWCNLAVHRLALETKSLTNNGCQIIAFVQSDTESIIHNIHDRHEVKPAFPIIADPDMEIYEEYGVGPSIMQSIPTFIKEIPDWVRAVHRGFRQEKVDGNLFLVPALFLVKAKNKTILKAWYGTSFYEHQTFTPVYEALVLDEAS